MANQDNHLNKTQDTSLPLLRQTPYTVPTKSLFQILWRNAWIVALTMVFTVTATAVYLSKVIPVYRSTSRIYVRQNGPRIISEMDEGLMTQSNNYLYTQAAILKSTPVLADLTNDPNIGKMKTFADVDNQIDYLKKNLDVSVGSMDEIISISLESPFAKEAAQIVNAVVKSYIAYQARSKRSSSADILKILQPQKEKLNTELTEKLKAMVEFKKGNPALAYENQRGNVILQRFERLSSVLTEAQLATIEKKSAYDTTKVIFNDPNGLRQFVEAQIAEGTYSSKGDERAALMTELEQLQRQHAERLRQLTADHPAVQALENEIADIKDNIAELDREFAQTKLRMMEQEYLAAKANEEQIQKHFEEQRLAALDLNTQLAQYTMLQSEWEQTKTNCDQINERIRDLNFTEDTGALNISVLEPARPANKRSDTNQVRYLSFALVLGFMAGSGLAFLRDLRDQKFRTTNEISATLGLPILGQIPSMPKRKSIVARGQTVYLEPSSPVAEAYRSIRTSIIFGAPNKKAKTILVTSARELEGKTTLASNLAIVMAQTGQRTLLLDADFRNPMQYKIFEINNNNDLVTLLSGTTTLENAIRSTPIEGLELLPCKTELINSSEIINSDSFAKLLEILSGRYDRIIIDSPPVVPVTDAQILAAICDITILLVRVEQTTKKMSQLARDGLLSIGARILGIVVNDVSKKDLSRYYGSYSQYYKHENRSKGKKSQNSEDSAGKVKSARLKRLDES
jgi:succinoglycan biosynthesis transport protein ExoP